VEQVKLTEASKASPDLDPLKLRSARSPLSQDFSLLSALELSYPGAKTWKDLGVTMTSTSKATAGILAALQA
jgi:hypothetical protein